MTRFLRPLPLTLLAASILSSHPVRADQNTHPFLRRPDVHGDQVVFSSEGDLWLASIRSGVARRVTSHSGTETNAHFSPDGATIAFDAQYDGGTDVYTMPVEGGTPQRLSYDPRGARVVGWTPDGKFVLFLSRRQNPENRSRLWKVSAGGGLPVMLPIPRADLAAMAPDGNRVAFIPVSAEWQHWKRYKGGQADHIWIADPAKSVFKRISSDIGIDTTPVWADDGGLYVISERAGLANLFRLNPANGSAKQITHYTDAEARYPGSDGKTVVFQHGDGLALYDIATNQISELAIHMTTDRIHARIKRVPAGSAVNSVSIGPTGKRVVAEARGQLISVPADEGESRFLAQMPGTRSQHPAWSKDGKQIAFISDRSGEDQVWVTPADASGAPKQLTRDHKGPLGELSWSPDGKYLLTEDREQRILLVDTSTGATTLVSQARYGANSYDSVNNSAVFSPDGKYVAYDENVANLNSVIYIYSIADRKTTAVTSPEVNSNGPAWDSEGKYLFFLQDRDLNPTGTGFTRFFTFDKFTCISFLTLAADTKSPFLPTNAEEGETPAPDAKADAPKPDNPAPPKPATEVGLTSAADDPVPAQDQPAPGPGRPAGRRRMSPDGGPAGPGGPPARPAQPVNVKIDFDGLSGRIIDLGVPGDRYRHLEVVDGRVLVLAPGDATAPAGPRGGGGRGGEGMALKAFSLKNASKSSLNTIASGVSDYEISGDRTKMLLRIAGQYAIVDASASSVAPDAPRVGLDNVTLVIDPPAEWKQIFDESWRVARDFFYDPNLYGSNWNAVRTRYAARLSNVADRSELNEVLGDMIAELNAGHAYVTGGDMGDGQPQQGPGARPVAPAGGMGYLGADFTADRGGAAFKIVKLLRGDGFDLSARSPLLAPGLNVREGDYIVAVGGQPVHTDEDIQASLLGTAGRIVGITVNSKPSMDGSRKILVRPMGDETKARYYDWTESRRQYVLKNGGPNLGYVQIPDMGNGGLTEFAKHYYSNLDKDGIIYDTRFNGGGHISAMLMLQMARKPYTWFKPRYGEPWTRQDFAFAGYSVCLINENNGSNGEEFPDVFQREQLGPVIGVRSWGGEVGSGGGYRLVDGGRISIPNYGAFAAGKWIIEGHGIEPDITVEQDPSQVLAGRDPQLDRAIAYLKSQIARKPVAKPVAPPFPIK